MLVDKLPESITMQLYLRDNNSDNLSGEILFSSSKRWLHPLFELDEFLAIHTKSSSKDFRTFEFEGGIHAVSSDLFLRDRVIGRAAAFLILRMGIRHIETDIVSRSALPLLKENSIAIETIETIDTTNCLTEDLLKDNLKHEEAYKILTEQRAKALERIAGL
jgi:hypothetical protein